jgi:hypothetical protein
LISYTWGHFQRKRQQVSQIVMMWIWQGKAYLPVLAEVKPGDFAEASPVYAAHLTQADLIAAMESVINTGHQPKPAQVDEEDPLLTATNAVSREELIRQATIFIVQWTREQVELDVVDAKNDALQRVQSFPADASLATISTTVLAAVRANDSRFALTSGSDETLPERDRPDQARSGGSR